MLKVNAIHVYYGAIHALKGVSFEVQQGELVTLLGANGAGKTTTLKTVSGLLRPARGSVELEGKALHRIDADEIVRRGVAHVPEGRKVFPRFTVLENLKIGGYARPKSALAPELDFAFQMFPRLKERQKQYAGTLSGGEQQMLAIARALVARPSLLIMDEPTEGLAPMLIAEVGRVIRRLRDEGASILLAEQNAAFAVKLADIVHVMSKGRVVYASDPETLWKDEEIKTQLLGVPPAADRAGVRRNL